MWVDDVGSKDVKYHTTISVKSQELSHAVEVEGNCCPAYVSGLLWKLVSILSHTHYRLRHATDL